MKVLLLLLLMGCSTMPDPEEYAVFSAEDEADFKLLLREATPKRKQIAKNASHNKAKKIYRKKSSRTIK